MGELQQRLRDSFEVGDEVLMAKRQYGDVPAAIIRGTIIGKQSAVAEVRCENGKKRAVPWTRLQKAPTPDVPKASPPKRTVVEQPRTRTPHFVSDGQVHIAEVVQRPPTPYRNEPVLRAVPEAFANLVASVSKNEPAQPPPKAAISTPMSAVARDTTTELAAWLEMGTVLDEQAERKLTALREDAALLREQARVLNAQAEQRDCEVAELSANLDAIREFRRQAETLAKLVLPSERH